MTIEGRDVRRVRALFISDVHLGMRAARVQQLTDFLRRHEADVIYLVGDIVDGWRLAKNWHWPAEYHTLAETFLEKALEPTFLFTQGDGWVDGGAPLKVDTKASWIEYVKRQPSPYIYRELDHVQVELHGDIAITLGRYFYLPQSNGQANHMHVWFERLYAKRNGQWQMLSHRTVKGPVRNDAVKTSSTQ